MGQLMTVEATPIGEVVIFGTDRSLTGQDGAGFEGAGAAEAARGFPAELARRIFSTHPAVEAVFIASNQVVVRGGEPWSGETVAAIADVITTFFRYYDPEE